MKVQIQHSHAKNVTFVPLEKEEIAELKYELKNWVSFDEVSPRKFAVGFEVDVVLQERFRLKMDFYTIFESEDDIANEDRENSFIKINAPAMAFPFFRAVICQTVVLFGFKPVILPPLNFFERAETSSPQEEVL